jgi:tetratricopeptide (TPR) repeat protein
MKCLEKRPENRYATGAELLAAVERIRKNIDAQQEKAIEPREARVPQPSTSEELVRMARQMLEDGKLTEVIDSLERAMERMSTSPRVMLIYAEAVKRAAKFDIAHTVYRRALGWMQAQGYSEDELKDAVEGLAETSIRLKLYEEAAHNYEWLSVRWPEKRWFRYRLGVSLGLSGRYQRSLDVLKHLHEESPTSSLICGKIGLAYEQMGDRAQACQYYNEALMIDIYEPTALFHLARVRAIEGKMDRALEYLGRLEQIEGEEQQAGELRRLLGKN